jgi:hypothetical protein
VAEGGGLLNRYTGQNLYQGFESLPHRSFARQPSLALANVRASYGWQAMRRSTSLSLYGSCDTTISVEKNLPV